MSRVIRLLLCVAGLGVVLAPVRALSQAPQAFAMAVVREDGILLPFARFDGTTWVQLWPEPSERLAAPASFREVPASWFPPDGRLPDTWHLWLIADPTAATSPFEARTARTLVPEKLVVFDAHCLKGVGVQTAYRGPDDRLPKPNAHPVPKAGVALTTPTLRVDQTVSLDPASPLAKWAEDRATLSFHRAEDHHLENFDPKERPQLEPFALRKSQPVRWTKVVRLGTAQARDRTYYLEGEVEYSPISIMAGHVWVQVAGDREVTDAEVVLTDQDHKRGTDRSSLGVVRVGDRRFWVFEAHGWESEAFEIFEASEVGKAPVSLLLVPSGGC